MTDNSGTREALVARLQELEGRAERIKADLSEPLSADFEEQATEAEDDEPLRAQETLVMQKVAAVRAAIVRVDESRYGLCITCGKTIAPDRLAALPEAANCVECATRTTL